MELCSGCGAVRSSRSGLTKSPRLAAHKVYQSGTEEIEVCTCFIKQVGDHHKSWV